MAARTTPAGLQIPNTPAPAAFANGVAGGWIGKTTTSGDQTVAGTEISLTGLVIAVTANASRTLRLSFCGKYAMSSGSGNRALYRIKEGATVIEDFPAAASTNGSEVASFFTIITPTAAVHTYSVTLQSPDAGNAVSKAGALFLIEDIGPA